MSDSARQLATIARALALQLGMSVREASSGRVHGGNINECHRLETERGSVFLKVADARVRSMLEAEAEGLRELAGAGAVRVPKVLALGEAAGSAYMALEWIDFAPGKGEAETRLGEELARQHRSSATRFGWHRDNTIGSTGQQNAWADDWVAFFRERRLRPQLELARSKKTPARLQDRGAHLLDRLEQFFATYRPMPSLLHGDLWGGNWAADAHGEPVIFDPAVYFGDREADLAMTRLFGGFGPGFYAAYETAWRPDPGAPRRVALYNLYHVLNHLNLFGGAYARQAEAMIDRLLADLGH